ncbi:uncharacterized protein [Halyomorpha halys]|uniref:uncharacterized protein n=1 Tax=Halyomorpha halys TaxID=286706 RepID=UPI0006D4D9E9|nr:uncharacterized protein LOC106682783 [Halyomorpha halys]
MQYSYLFLVLAVAAVNSEVVDINSRIDNFLAQSNEFFRKHKFTSIRVPQGSFGPHLSFSDSDVLGLDSFKRTGPCTLEVIGKNATFDLHYGFGFYQQSFNFMSFNDQAISASFRVRDNSLHLRYTVHNGQRCYVTVHDLSFERLAKVDFSSSRSEYDGINVKDSFEKEVIPFLNSKIDKAAIEKTIEKQSCPQQQLELSQHMPMIHMTILKQIGVPAQ